MQNWYEYLDKVRKQGKQKRKWTHKQKKETSKVKRKQEITLKRGDELKNQIHEEES